MHTPSVPGSRLRLADGLTAQLLFHHRVCPIEVSADGHLVVAAATDHHASAMTVLEESYGIPIRALAMDDAEVLRAIERLAAHSETLSEGAPEGGDSADRAADAREMADQPPVIRFVNQLIRSAFDSHASDIHIESDRSGALVSRLRIDGVLMDGPSPSAALARAVASRVKLLAELDISERRKPQDGRVRVRLETRELDLRVSTVPTLHGESIVIRLLDQGGRPGQLEDLGLGATDLSRLDRICRKAHGLVLVTGPTGSGKTSTLYAALTRRDTTTEKVITVEDPVEYELAGITQVPVHAHVGVTMGGALRSILRQDPDVIMVGEMRDTETAETAIQAAMTGHLVFSTLHTTDAIGAVPRLVDLGVAGYLVAATLDAVLAQRLVRVVCAHCRVLYDPDPEHVSLVSGRPESGRRLVRGSGCAECRGSGFRGRTGIFELLLLDDRLREAIARGAPRTELEAIAEAGGHRRLLRDAWEKVTAGITTIEEVLRVAAD